MKVIRELSGPGEVEAVLKRVRSSSERKLRLMRDVACDIVRDNRSVIIGVNGSIARREVTDGSDVDLFVLSRDGDIEEACLIQEECRSSLNKKGLKMPAPGGVFENPLAACDLISKIGGEDDTNTHITRRMLCLLEGEWVANQAEFEKLREELIKKYVPDDMADHKFCRYLLNDVIRYWRTICVDFEFKTASGDKPRALRLVKLRLSRMMLYFAGVAAISQTAHKKAREKRETLARLFSKPPIARLIAIFGHDRMADALAAYATFLQAMDQPEIRSRLDAPDGLETDAYHDLRCVAKTFRCELQKLFRLDGMQRIATALLF